MNKVHPYPAKSLAFRKSLIHPTKGIQPNPTNTTTTTINCDEANDPSTRSTSLRLLDRGMHLLRFKSSSWNGGTFTSTNRIISGIFIAYFAVRVVKQSTIKHSNIY
jgi:hypothetical protein